MRSPALTPRTKLAAFGLLLIAVFAAASYAGAALDPSVDEPDAHTEGEMAGGATHETDAGHEAGAGAMVPGLAVAEAGYRLIPERTSLPLDRNAELSFRIVDEAGTTVQDFDVEHERRMHLIVVRRDFANFQHLHPKQLGDGSWAVDADLREGGTYRVFADFATAGEALTLATDISVAGDFQPRTLPSPATVADAGDGYEVALTAGEAHAGETAPVEFTVSRHGKPVDGVEPYLGADGHLVALREHDQAFLHTHPEGDPGGPGPISFGVEYPTAGRYRLFLQFRHAGEVRTAEFTQVVGDEH
jgi:hypothetical protein